MDRSAVAQAKERLRKLDARDAPLLEFWKRTMPGDFEDDDVEVLSLDFEMSGIERGLGTIKEITPHTDLTGKSVLDIGAGNGGLCIACGLAGAETVSGLELDEARIQLARRWAECRGVRIELHQGVAEALPFPDESFDVVFLSSVIEHVDSHERTLSELRRVLKRNGIFFIDGPNRLSPRWFIEDPHYRTPAVSILPRPIAKWWVTRVLRATEHYDVGVFPIFALLARDLRRRGLIPLTCGHYSWVLEALKRPEIVKRGAKRTLLEIGRAVGLNRLLGLWIENTAPTFWVVGRRV
jgi:2-polyprenyl-3-methyl-5-hydroxy-6-metoxy-1,4-benzoquinol methylase